jgi:two-component system LytT family response regulator
LAVRPRETVAVPATTTTPLRRIPLKEDGVVAFIETRDVESIAADGDYVKLNGRFGTRTLRQSLSALEKQLDPAEFARIHRSTIVSLSDIKELQPWFHGEYMAIMASGAKLKVSRSHRAALTEALGI